MATSNRAARTKTEPCIMSFPCHQSSPTFSVPFLNFQFVNEPNDYESNYSQQSYHQELLSQNRKSMKKQNKYQRMLIQSRLQNKKIQFQRKRFQQKMTKLQRSLQYIQSSQFFEQQAQSEQEAQDIQLFVKKPTEFLNKQANLTNKKSKDPLANYLPINNFKKQNYSKRTKETSSGYHSPRSVI